MAPFKDVNHVSDMLILFNGDDVKGAQVAKLLPLPTCTSRVTLTKLTLNRGNWTGTTTNPTNSPPMIKSPLVGGLRVTGGSSFDILAE